MLYRASVRIKQAHAVERDCGASRLPGACWAPPGGVSELVVSSQEEALVSQSLYLVRRRNASGHVATGGDPPGDSAWGIGVPAGQLSG